MLQLYIQSEAVYQKKVKIKLIKALVLSYLQNSAVILANSLIIILERQQSWSVQPAFVNATLILLLNFKRILTYYPANIDMKRFLFGYVISINCKKSLSQREHAFIPEKIFNDQN